MDVFNKVINQVSSSVHSTVSQLSGVLPGNPVTREFESSAHIASAGPGLLWKIYKGNKRSTRQEASIFVFEKRQLDRYSKTDRELILEVLRRGVVQLTKIRHPKILTVQHPLEESRDSLAFAAEPVFASLANVLGQTTNMPQPANMSDYKLFDIEIKYGVLQLTEGLAFLHNDVKLLHKNISPESVIINTQGAWKVFGFDFCVINTNPANMPPSYIFEEYSATVPPVCQPNLDYLAPEHALSLVQSQASDMFSLGMLICTLYSPDRKCFKPVRDLQQFRARAQELKKFTTGKIQFVPEELREFIKLLLNVTSEVRPDAHQFVKIPFFDDIGIKTLTYLDSVLQWDNLQKSQFYKGLPEALTKLPHRVKLQRVVACLAHDLGQPAMVPFILPSLLEIAQGCTQKEYCSYILPLIKPLMTLLEPVQVLLIMLQNMELLLKLTPAEDIQRHVLPMLYRGLDSDTPQIHELCLSVLPTFAGLLDHSNVKNSLLPRIKKLCLNTSTLSVRVNCLLCVGRLLEHLDKWLVLDEVLPFLPQIPSREPAVLMGILGIYKLALNHKKLGITKEIIASRVLPFLIPLCIENGLTIPQFNALTALVKDMFQIVETEHRTKLEQLNSVKDEQKTLASTTPIIMPKSKPIELDSAFSGLGLDNYVPGMSLKQKQQLAQQQDSLKVFSSQPSIEPKKVDNAPKSVTKDLSSSLLDDWVSSTATSSKKQSFNTSNTHNLSPTDQTSKNSPSNTSTFVGNTGISQTGLMSSNSNTQWQMGKPNNSTTPNYSPFTTQNQNFMNNNLNTAGSNPWSSSHNAISYNRPDNSQNWSAFDNLLPGTNTNINTGKVPMNKMMSHNVPLLPSSNTNSGAKSAGLSNDDIMDLLS
ncbi:SCY1-like protein 2 [Diabrotica undecimpunctata]|uniref:SCY1-like protein 2 n=1 Tax=Diabrotica undecimpunctata TaxID=50387 RepID=UPI003B632578